MIPTETLLIVRAVAHFRNFTAAAKHLNKVPSAISYTVRKLEDNLGVQLFIRDNKRVELTRAGEHFIANTEKLLQELDALEKSTQQMASGWESELHIALDNIVNHGRMYDLIEAFQQVRPQTDLIINTEVYNGSWDALYHGRCQLVIGAPKDIPEAIIKQGDCAWLSMGKLTWDFVVAPTHPLAQYDTALTMENIAKYRSICIQDTSRFFRHGYNLFLEGQEMLVVPNFRVAIECLTRGLGATILPSHFAEPYIKKGLLVRKEVIDLNYNDSCLLAWNTKNMGQGLKWILSWLGCGEQLNQKWLQADSHASLGFHVP